MIRATPPCGPMAPGILTGGSHIFAIVSSQGKWYIFKNSHNKIGIYNESPGNRRGPAGATVAHELASVGLKVLALEEKRLPHYKPCGGCLSLKIERILDHGFKEVVYGAILPISPKGLFLSSPIGLWDIWL